MDLVTTDGEAKENEIHSKKPFRPYYHRTGALACLTPRSVCLETGRVVVEEGHDIFG